MPMFDSLKCPIQQMLQKFCSKHTHDCYTPQEHDSPSAQNKGGDFHKHNTTLTTFTPSPRLPAQTSLKGSNLKFLHPW